MEPSKTAEASKIYLSVADGMPYWFSYAAPGDDPDFTRARVPVVLRVPTKLVRNRQIDTWGSRDAGAEAYTVTASIMPEAIEVWTGDEWVPVKQYNKIHVDDYEVGMDPNDSELLPPECDSFSY